MPAEQSAMDKVVEKTNAFLEKPVGALQFVVDTVMRDGSIAALGREGMKSIQDAWFDTAYGHSDHSREPGSPLTPLFSDIKEAKEQHERPEAAQSLLPSPQDKGEKDRDGGTVHGPANQEKAQENDGKVDFGSWKERVAARREQAEQEQQKEQPTREQEHDRSRE